MNYQIDNLVFHEFPMILVDRVISCDEDGIITAVDITPETPFMYNNRVPSYIVVEYMAQTIAAYTGVQSQKAGKEVAIGFLLGTRKLLLHTQSFEPGEKIRIEASPLYNDGEIASFDCIAKRDNQIIAMARLNVYQPNSKQGTDKQNE